MKPTRGCWLSLEVMWPICFPVVQWAGLDGQLGTLDGGIHAHVAIKVGVGAVAAPAGGDQLGPDREGASWEALLKCTLDRFGSIVEITAILEVEGLDVEECIIDDVARIGDRVGTELDAAWCQRTHGAVEACGHDLAARNE